MVKTKSSGSNLNSKWLEARDSSAGLEAWGVIVGPAHPGDARLDSAFKVVAELSVLRRVGEEAVLLAVDPEEPLILAGFFGFRFLVWILSFFIASGLGTPWSFM